jgi:hypothetical protein
VLNSKQTERRGNLEEVWLCLVAVDVLEVRSTSSVCCHKFAAGYRNILG